MWSKDELVQKVLGMDNWLKGKDFFALAWSLTDRHRGFFMKREKAMELLRQFPPEHLPLENNDFASLFAALRFTQSEMWMHRFFDEAYQDLTADDFEERDVELKMLDQEWMDGAAQFEREKMHNVSHLKELGIIFVAPDPIDQPGEATRDFALLIHYLNEVPYYSALFKKHAHDADFVKKLQSLLRGDVPDGPAPAGSIRIIQRYLAKNDPDDWRLKEPHVNPEVEHWHNAESDLAKLGGDFAGWTEHDCDQNLMDLAMSLVRDIPIDYHAKEAQWNQKIIDTIGRENMNDLIERHITEGFVPLP